MIEKRTDLAIEVRESFPEDHVEISGVSLEEKSFEQNQIHVTTVKILNEQGSKQMGKPVGTYVTLEYTDQWMMAEQEVWEQYEKKLAEKLAEILEQMTRSNDEKKRQTCFLVTGLGNRFATPDALGPFVIENVLVNRHLQEDTRSDSSRTVCALSPGVMSQTGIETGEILQGIIQQTRPDCLIVIDALASRSVGRLCRTVQVTDAGILPGAGIGNNRFPIDKTTMQIPVIAIGVPTVVDANIIVMESMEEVLHKEDFSEQQIQMFLRELSGQTTKNLFVTPKDIDEQVRQIGKIIATGINHFLAV